MPFGIYLDNGGSVHTNRIKLTKSSKNAFQT